MHKSSGSCPRREAVVAGGKGLIEIKDLAAKSELYDHARMFAHVTVHPGCSIGYHGHEHETEFYYILKGEAVFCDNGEETLLHPGDISATGFGQKHGLENRSDSDVELIALIMLE